MNPTTTDSTLSLPPFIDVSTSVSANMYYQEETIQFNNTIILTDLSITITVQKTLNISNPNSYDTIGGGIISRAINNADTQVIYTFSITNGNTLWPGQWSVAAQFDLNGQTRNTNNDTYAIRTGFYQIISGHF